MRHSSSPLRADKPSLEEIRSEPVADAISPMGSLKDHECWLSSERLEEIWGATAGRAQLSSRENLDVSDGSKVGLDDAQMTLIQKFVAENMGDPISSETLEGLVDLRRHRFNRMFSHSFKTTPMRFVKGARIVRAKQLLAATDLKLVEIARQCGFPDSAHFNRVFSAETGMPPRRWRICCRI